MLVGQCCESFEEQSVLDYEKLFKDPEFGPESKYNPLYFNGDLSEKEIASLDSSSLKL
jgi:hypothetical protein